MDAIHAGGSIYYDKDRLAAYTIIALLASDLRRGEGEQEHELSREIGRITSKG